MFNHYSFTDKSIIKQEVMKSAVASAAKPKVPKKTKTPKSKKGVQGKKKKKQGLKFVIECKNPVEVSF